MTQGDFVCCLEEKSAKEILRCIIPKVLGTNKVNIKFKIFEGKGDLDTRIHRQINNYLVPNSVFLVVRDQDNENCQKLKTSLLTKIPVDKKIRTKVRIACRELESFYLGDLAAVEKGLELKGLAKKQDKQKFRAPDEGQTAAKLLQKETEYKYQKVMGSEKIAPYLKLDGSNKSKSFQVLLQGIEYLYKVLKTL
jgi:hypothetical protein